MRYETEEDLENEGKCKELLEKVWGYKAHKLAGNNEKKYLMDFVLMNKTGKAIRFVEYKARKDINHDTFEDGVILGLQKFNKGLDYYYKNQIDFYFVVEFKDGFHYYKYHPDHDLPIKYASSCKNQEPVVLIKPEYWEKLHYVHR